MENTGYRLLIAEDDALMQEAVTDYFASKGWITDAASNGVQALEKAKRKLSPDSSGCDDAGTGRLFGLQENP